MRTAQQIFDHVLVLMFGEQEDVVDHSPYFLPVLNQLLAENFRINNELRVIREKDKMTTIPDITSLTDDVEYEPEFTRYILPYGVAGYMFAEDDYKTNNIGYRDKYEYERSQVLGVQYDITGDDDVCE